MTTVVLLNGPFGVGKTSVATELCRRYPGSVVYDPELVGSALQRRPRWISLEGSGTDDFQDLALWRRSVGLGVRAARWLARGPVFVPIAFSNRSYLAEVLADIRRFERHPRVFCLTASLDTIHARLRRRGVAEGGGANAWSLRRAAECVAAHTDPFFGEPIDTEHRSIAEVATALENALRL